MSIYVDDEGIGFELEFRDYEMVGGVLTDMGPLDISAATEITFLFQKPDGSVVSKTKSSGKVADTTDGTDGKAIYVSEPGFLDVAGTWQRQGVVTLSSGKHHSEKKIFKVMEHL